MMLNIEVACNLKILGHDFEKEGLRVGILAMSGAGKSNLAALFAEQALESGWQVVIIEPISEWHTLKAMYPQVIVAGGEYGDLQVTSDPEIAQLLVDLLERTNASLVLNVSDIEDEVEQKNLVARFLWALYRRWQRIRRPILLILEEADVWAPQSWSKEDRPCLSRVSLLAKHGRKLGINLVIISQRPSDIHKSPLSQCNILFFGLFKSPQDLSPTHGVMYIAKKLEIPITEKEITSLEPGEFYAWVKDKVVKIKAKLRKTPHGGETPIFRPAPIPKGIEEPLKVVREKLSALLVQKKQEQTLIEKLKKEIERLTKENEELKRQIDILKTVREVPVEIKAEPIQIPIEIPTKESTVIVEPRKLELSLDLIPAPVKRCPIPGALDVYYCIRNHKDWIKTSDIQKITGISREKITRILKYFYRYKLIEARWMRWGSKSRFSRVRVRG